MRSACGFHLFTVNAGNPGTNELLLTVEGNKVANGVTDNGLYVLVVIGGIGLVAGLEVEDLTVASLIETSGTEYLAGLVSTDEEKLLGLGNTKRLAVHFLMLKEDELVNALCNGVRGIDNPYTLVSAVLTPRQVAGSTHQSLEGLGMVTGVKEEHTHALKNRVTHFGNNRVGYLVMSDVTPPDQNVGVIKQLVGNAAVGIVEGYGLYLDIITAKKVCNGVVDTVRINLANGFLGLLMAVLVIDSYTNHNILLALSGLFLFYVKPTELF
jgi:hypothetical protein